MESSYNQAQNVACTVGSTEESSVGQVQNVFSRPLPRKQRGGLKKSQKPQKNKEYNDSCWTLKENIAYKQFIEQNLHLFAKTREERRLMKINVLISKYVKTRSSDQCRSHHQKMIKYHKDLPQIIAHIEKLEEQHGTKQTDFNEDMDGFQTVPSPTPELKMIDQIPQAKDIWDFFVQGMFNHQSLISS